MPRTIDLTLRWLAGAAGGRGSDCLYSGPGDVPSLLVKLVSPILLAPRREAEGRKWVNSMRRSHVDVSQPFPLSTLPACCFGDVLVSLGFGQGGDMPSALLSPSLPLLVTVPRDLWGLPCPRDRRDVWSLRPLGMVGLVSPHFTTCPKNRERDTPFLVWGFGYSFGGTKPCRG